MSDLAQFLLDRISEDEEVARAAFDGRPGALIGPEWWDKPEHGRVYSGHWVPVVETTSYQEPAPEPGEVGTTHHGLGRDSLAHIARWDPARVLAECEAKKTTVGLYREVADLTSLRRPGTVMPHEHARVAAVQLRALEGVLRLLALPYAHHDGYREEWRP